MGHPTIYPTGVTLYDKSTAWNGYTVFPSAKGALLIDMNGREVHVWEGFGGSPNKLLPGGYLLGSTGTRDPEAHPFDNMDLVQKDWDGNTVWKFDRLEYVADPGYAPQWVARQNHDYEREGSPTGYFSPGAEPKTDGGNTLLIVNSEVTNPGVSGKALLDSKIIEVSWDGNIVWQWSASDHFEELGFDEAAKNVIYRLPSDELSHGGYGFWLAINSISTFGKNRWYDAGDQRFHPDNIIWSARNANILGAIDKRTGKIVYRIGPDFSKISLGWIIGPHHFHLIPRGCRVRGISWYSTMAVRPDTAYPVMCRPMVRRISGGIIRGYWSLIPLHTKSNGNTRPWKRGTFIPWIRTNSIAPLSAPPNGSRMAIP
jgi:hypothetical protein